MIFPIFGMSLNGLVRAEGHARVAMTGMITGAVLNIILDAIFIIPLDMGIKGAALATVIAQFVSVVYFISYYLTGSSYLKIRLGNFRIEPSILKSIFAIGIASLARTLTGSLSAIIVNRMLGTYGGDYAISAFGVIHRIMMFAMMPGIVIGQGLQPILGFNYGAKRYGRALRVIAIASVAATACCLAVFLVLYFIPEPIIRIFTSDSELISLSAYAARRIFLALYLLGFMMVGSLIFQSIGKATQSFVTAIARTVLFLIPLLFILPRFLQIEGVWLSFPISDALTFILTIILLIPQVRELRKMSMLAKT
jgi:Na+-driven multidrug efflux pump